MRVYLLASLVLLLLTAAFGLLAWLAGDGLPARLLAMLAIISGLFLTFAAFLAIAQALSNLRRPRTDGPAAPTTATPASPTGVEPGGSPKRRRAA